jgi:hypothetical protein
VLISLVHHIFHYLKDTLTVPKIKDLVNEPSKKYNNMYKIINQSSTPINELKYHFLPEKKIKSTEMKNELKNFLKEKMKSESALPFDSHDSTYLANSFAL